MPDLEEVMTKWRIEQAHKHGLDENYAHDSINEMTNYEFMVELSNAIEQMKELGCFK